MLKFILLALFVFCLTLAMWGAVTVVGCIMPPLPEEMKWPAEKERLRYSLRGAERACESYRREITEAETIGDAKEAAKLTEALRQTEAGVARLRTKLGIK